jgi:hypothetical protein
MLHSYAIFCDDVRQEITGKNIFIGVYRDQMLFAGEAPWFLPMLNVHIVFRLPAQSPMPKVELELRATDADGVQTLFQVQVPTDAPDNGANQLLPFETEPGRTFMSAFTLTLSPLKIDKPTKLTVHAIVDGEDDAIERLRIDRNPRV